MKSLFLTLTLLLTTPLCFARGGHSSRHSSGISHTHRNSSSGYGTGSNPRATRVHGYSKKDGTYVAPHRRSAADRKVENNWSAKPNRNPDTGEEGKKVSPPNQ